MAKADFFQLKTLTEKIVGIDFSYDCDEKQFLL